MWQNLYGQQPGVKDTGRVSKQSRDWGLAGTIAHIRGHPTRPEEHLIRLLQDVFGAEPRHRDDSLTTSCGTCEGVLAGSNGRRGGGGGRGRGGGSPSRDLIIATEKIICCRSYLGSFLPMSRRQ